MCQTYLRSPAELAHLVFLCLKKMKTQESMRRETYIVGHDSRYQYYHCYQVSLIVNRENQEACAVKEINLRRANEDDTNRVKKEILVHKLLKHKNIVQCYGSRLEGSLQMMFLEYCR